MAQKTVLIIEDDTGWYNLLRQIICDVGYFEAHTTVFHIEIIITAT